LGEQLSLASIFKEFGKDINQRIEFDEFETMVPPSSSPLPSEKGTVHLNDHP
jgi:hypothetical protein